MTGELMTGLNVQALLELTSLAARERPTAIDSAREQLWVIHAACRGHSQLFFPARAERPQARVRREALARAMCEHCPVIEPCRAAARRYGEYGFWGGESDDERHAVTATLRVQAAELHPAS